VFTGVCTYKYIYIHVHTYFDRKSYCAHYLLFLIYIIENNNECNSKTKGNAVRHDVKKFGYCARKNVMKFSEPYGTGKNIIIEYVISSFLIACSKNI